MELGLTTSPSTPCAPSWYTPKTRHRITKSVVSSMKSSVRNALRSMSRKLPIYTLETRMKDHLKQKSPQTAVGDHEHPIKMDNVKAIAREDNIWRCKIHESIEIRTRRPAINRDQGYELPSHLWRTAVMWPLFRAVTWPRRINLICLMEWPWWLCKLATLQHIWLW